MQYQPHKIKIMMLKGGSLSNGKSRNVNTGTKATIFFLSAKDYGYIQHHSNIIKIAEVKVCSY